VEGRRGFRLALGRPNGPAPPCFKTCLKKCTARTDENPLAADPNQEKQPTNVRTGILGGRRGGGFFFGGLADSDL